VGVTLKDRNLILTKSQAACLIALREHEGSMVKIAIHAKLDLAKTTTALSELARLKLAKQDETKKWQATARGKARIFDTLPDKLRRGGGVPGPAGLRLLELLDCPKHGTKIAEQLGVTHQRTRQLVIKLHAQGRVSFGDPESPFWIVMRVGDKTPILSRAEERVLSAIPPEFATSAKKIKLVAHMPESEVQQTLDGLIARGFVEARGGIQGARVFRITLTGLKHPQYDQSAPRAQAPRLPAGSERIRRVFSAILESGALRIRDVSDAVREPLQSINALMQYLKRKQMVEKTGQEPNAPYALTDEGRAVLTEMTRRRAA